MFSPGVKWPGHDADHAPMSSAKIVVNYLTNQHGITHSKGFQPPCIMMVDTASSPEALVHFCQTILCHMPKTAVFI
jgi:hypothetical protein